MTPDALAKLSPEQKGNRIAIIMGWKWRVMPAKAHAVTDQMWVYPVNGGYTHKRPDYLNDLNACHEFENTLNPPPMDREQDREDDDPRWVMFEHHLSMICPMGTFIHATAAQRADAFLLPVG